MFLNKVGGCRYNEATFGTSCTGYEMTVSGDEENLRSVVSKVGPVSVTLSAALQSFQFYSSGVYSDSDCTGSFDHAALVTGFGAGSGRNREFWIIKNRLEIVSRPVVQVQFVDASKKLFCGRRSTAIGDRTRLDIFFN